MQSSSSQGDPGGGDGLATAAHTRWQRLGATHAGVACVHARSVFMSLFVFPLWANKTRQLAGLFLSTAPIDGIADDRRVKISKVAQGQQGVLPLILITKNN